MLSLFMLYQALLCVAGWSEVSRRERCVAAVCALLGLVALVLGPSSRGAILAAFAIIGVTVLWFAFARMARAKLKWGVATFALCALMFALVAGHVVLRHLKGVLDILSDPNYVDWVSSEGTRLMMYCAAFSANLDAPGMGFGMHMRFAATLPYYPAPPPEHLDYSHVHNIFLTHGVAAGLPGIIAVLIVILTPLALTLRPVRAKRSVVWLGLVATLGLFGLGLMETILFQDLNLAFTMFLFVRSLHLILDISPRLADGANWQTLFRSSDNTIRRQGFWHQVRLKLRVSLAHLADLIMQRAGGDASGVLRASFV